MRARGGASMRRAFAPLALTLALLAPPALAAAPSAVSEDLQCLDPLGATLCAHGVVHVSLECGDAGPDRAQCWGNVTWAAQGGWNTAAGLAGSTLRAGSALLEWCDPGGLCRGVGVGLLVVTCTFTATAPRCGNTTSYSIWTGGILLAPGQCIEPTLSGWILVEVRTEPRAVQNLVFGNQPALRATATPQTGTTACR